MDSELYRSGARNRNPGRGQAPVGRYYRNVSIHYNTPSPSSASSMKKLQGALDRSRPPQQQSPDEQHLSPPRLGHSLMHRVLETNLEEIPRKRSRAVEPLPSQLNDQSSSRADAERQSGTFIIYLPRDEKPEAPVNSFTLNDSTCMQSNLGTGGCLMSTHDPAEATLWIEENWDSDLVTFIQQSLYGGPFACMISPDEPGLALFASCDDPMVLNVAQSLAESSGFSVVIRPASDNPALTLLTRDTDPNNGYVQFNNTGSSDNDGSQNGGDSNDEDEDEGEEQEPNRDDGSQDPGGDEDEDGESQDPAVMGNKWEGPLHSTRVKLRLKPNPAQTYAVAIGYTFKFTINRDTEIPLDLNDLSRPLSQPEVIAVIDLDIETIPRETQVDRSYASIGFVSHRAESIDRRKFLYRGFDLPDKVYKRTQQRQTQRGFQGAVGFSGGPTSTATFSHNRMNGTGLEATDIKAMPKCLVEYENGEEWDEDNKSYSSYNVVYQAQNIRLDDGKPEYHPLEVKVGMGINLRPAGSEAPLPQISFVNRNQVLIWVSDPTSKTRVRGIMVLMSSYLDNIRAEKLSIYEQKEIELEPVSVSTPQVRGDEQKPGTISLSIAQVERPCTPASNELRAVPSFLAKLGQRGSPSPLACIPPREYLARGWDANNKQWRHVLWPALDKDFRRAEVGGKEPIWKIQWKGAGPSAT